MTGIKAGDKYTVFIGVGNSVGGSMNMRKYTIEVGPKNEFGAEFDGCETVGSRMPLRNGVTQR